MPRSSDIPLRIGRATLIAPLTAPALYVAGAIAGHLLDPTRRGRAFDNLLEGVPVVFAFGAPVAYAATLLALPVLWLVSRLSPRRTPARPFAALTARRTILVGFAVGAGAAWGLEPWFRGEMFSIPLPRWAGGAIGAATAAVWWWIASNGVSNLRGYTTHRFRQSSTSNWASASAEGEASSRQTPRDPH